MLDGHDWDNPCVPDVWIMEAQDMLHDAVGELAILKLCWVGVGHCRGTRAHCVVPHASVLYRRGTELALMYARWIIITFLPLFG